LARPRRCEWCGQDDHWSIASGLVTPWSGEVLLDGSSISEWDPDTLAATLATVEQQVVLFAGTVRDNVTLWDDTVDDERVIRPCVDAALLRDAPGRPGGLGAPVLDGGRNFSGGQRQRIGTWREHSCVIRACWCLMRRHRHSTR